MERKFYAGAGQADVTPKVGCMLYGYSPMRPSTSVHDGLALKAFLLKRGEESLLLASAEVCAVRGSVCDRARAVLAEAAGIPVENVILGAIHTHSGPDMGLDENGRPNEPEYLEKIFYPACAKAAAEAAASLRPAELGIGITESRVAVNRRQILPDGSVALGQEPLGLFDPRMTVIALRDTEGKSIGNLVHYGCHNTGCGKNPEISRDWCGVMLDRLAAETGGVSAFLNGCQGDCGPRLTNGRTTGDLGLALELGGRAASDAMEAYRSIREWRREPELRVLRGSVRLPYAALPDEAEVDAKLTALGDPAGLEGLDLLNRSALLAAKVLLHSPEANDRELVLPMTVAAVGPAAFVPLPFETFSGITMRVARESPWPVTLAVSNGNGSRGYFPTQQELCMGGYEVEMFLNRPHPLVRNADQHLVSGCGRLLRELWEREN